MFSDFSLGNVSVPAVHPAQIAMYSHNHKISQCKRSAVLVQLCQILPHVPKQGVQTGAGGTQGSGLSPTCFRDEFCLQALRQQ